ncbi:MAG: bifunctional methylenetetrahydrofolate dehydrogenase/methenyltetrahydrofolate cyclohydrolase FolD [candidate division Zixibacteria bacterium HGW-Zixibacteria-1]|nr:MAG: bifunctional methylenetetrahydrofolate dehydrogenase/methenyltetrahydrofolate cyclohydrolase FolD [candidate division Zixibacteria bacterium HGW-Zixibacteria-1]
MEAKIIDGKIISNEIKEELKLRVDRLRDKGITPGLAAVLVGENPASQIYVRSKAKACEKIGIFSEVMIRPADISQKELAGIVDDLNHRDDIDGILVQLPLPGHIDEMAITLRIDPAKDVDGFHPHNVGMMLLGHPTFLSCTPYGIVELMRRYDIDPSGREVVVLGRSNIVGKPIGVMLMQKAKMANATVTFCHSRTANLEEVCRRADILIAAIGKAEFVKADMVKEGAVIIDVGINRVDDASADKGYRVVGDVDFAACSKKASHITPVPGGVGPMTITMLLTNTVQSAEAKAERMSKA